DLHPGAELPHEGHGHVDIGRRDERTVYFDHDVAPGQGRDQQQPAQELTADVTFDTHAATVEAVGVDDHGRAAIPQFARGLDTKLAQGREQVFDGPFAHPRDAVKAIPAVPQAD